MLDELLADIGRDIAKNEAERERLRAQLEQQIAVADRRIEQLATTRAVLEERRAGLGADQPDHTDEPVTRTANEATEEQRSRSDTPAPEPLVPPEGKFARWGNLNLGEVGVLALRDVGRVTGLSEMADYLIAGGFPYPAGRNRLRDSLGVALLRRLNEDDTLFKEGPGLYGLSEWKNGAAGQQADLLVSVDSTETAESAETPSTASE